MEEKRRANAEKTTKTKEELAALRKDMMKKKPNLAKTVVQEEQTPVPDHPKAALMSRLASGSKTEVDKKSMLKLTNKNYENLPEVKRRREEEAKKEDMRKRMEQVK